MPGSTHEFAGTVAELGKFQIGQAAERHSRHRPALQFPLRCTRGGRAKTFGDRRREPRPIGRAVTLGSALLARSMSDRRVDDEDESRPSWEGTRPNVGFPHLTRQARPTDAQGHGAAKGSTFSTWTATERRSLGGHDGESVVVAGLLLRSIESRHSGARHDNPRAGIM